jgi:hypothetical protein
LLLSASAFGGVVRGCDCDLDEDEDDDEAGFKFDSLSGLLLLLPKCCVGSAVG